jgi:hypothetical protein
MTLWYLSFSGDDGWLGACVVEADSLPAAIAWTHEQAINPGGDVLAGDLTEVGLTVPMDWRGRTMTTLRELGEFGIACGATNEIGSVFV